MTSITYSEATCVYPGSTAPALDRLNLDIQDGEFMVFVGPSGSGKSTALRLLAGLEGLTAGEILIGGTDVSRKPPKDRNIAMVFQSYALYPHLNVADNIGFGLRINGVAKAERREKVREVARLLDLEEYLERKPRALSGGQRQRVAMGRAIARQPSAFLMDEPLSNLDAKLRLETRANIAELQARLGTTTVYVTHDQVEAMTMGHRVAVLKDGVLQQVDTPRNLYDRPVNAFVAGFIGSPAMNLRRAEVVPGGARLGDATVSLPEPALAAIHQASLTHLLLGVRPEEIVIAAPNNGARIRATVSLVEELGADAYVYCSLAGDEARAAPVVVRASGRVQPRVGDSIALEVADGAGHVFHPDTGARL